MQNTVTVLLDRTVNTFWFWVVCCWSVNKEVTNWSQEQIRYSIILKTFFFLFRTKNIFIYLKHIQFKFVELTLKYNLKSIMDQNCT